MEVWFGFVVRYVEGVEFMLFEVWVGVEVDVVVV